MSIGKLKSFKGLSEGTLLDFMGKEELAANLRTLITEQKAALRVSHDEIKMLRDAS